MIQRGPDRVPARFPRAVSSSAIGGRGVRTLSSYCALVRARAAADPPLPPPEAILPGLDEVVAGGRGRPPATDRVLPPGAVPPRGAYPPAGSACSAGSPTSISPATPRTRTPGTSPV